MGFSRHWGILDEDAFAKAFPKIAADAKHIVGSSDTTLTDGRGGRPHVSKTEIWLNGPDDLRAQSFGLLARSDGLDSYTACKTREKALYGQLYSVHAAHEPGPQAGGTRSRGRTP